MNKLKPHSVEWLEFARSIGATHWHINGSFYKIDSGNHLVGYTQKGWEPSFYTPELLNNIFSKIDFSPLDNKPSEPDWSKAPEGANLFWTSKWTTNPWFKDENGKLYNFVGLTLSWVETKGPGFMPNEIIKRPTVNQQLTVEWNGTGLPPVGTVCEVYSEKGWITCEVIAHHNGEVVVAVKEEGISDYSYHSGVRVRPIKSGREQWIDDAVYQCILHYGNPKGAESYRSLCVKLYDAGLAKLPEQAK